MGSKKSMAEYLSPGIFVEEFDSGAVPMSSVSTSTAGFVGVTEKGPQEGEPVLITSFSDYYRVFGGYLSESEFGEYRYLPYAISQFFTNGGSRCFIKRVTPSDAAFAHFGQKEDPLLVYAKNPGLWGNKISLTILPSSRAKTQILEEITSELGVKYRVKNANGFTEGDIILFESSEGKQYNRITGID